MKKVSIIFCEIFLVVLILFGFPKINHGDTINTTYVTEQEDSQVSYFFYDATEHGYFSNRSDVLTPIFYIYSGNLDTSQADSLISELQMQSAIEKWGSQIYVVNPLNGKNYSEEDSRAFLQLISKSQGTPKSICNIKVIGIDEGATFVNNQLSESLFPVAGVLTIGGIVTETNKNLNTAIPAYISNSSQNVADSYIKANDSQLTETDDTHSYYQNPKNELQKVVVSNKEETLAEAFSNAWTTVFSKNYRMHNDKTEFYLANPSQITSDYRLTPISDFEKIGITYNQMENQPINGQGKYTWYEYVPKNLTNDDSAALIVTLHGFGNDPRIQGDTSGWVELSSKENLIVISPEWQGKEENFAKVEGLGEKGVLSLIELLKKKYPQIDASRIYITGLSAGGSKAALWGAKYSKIFVAAGSISAPGIDKEELLNIADNYKGSKVPFIYICGDHDFFQMIPVDGSSPNGMQNIFFDDPNVPMFQFIQAYQKINKMEVSDQPNLNLNPYYGISLENQKEEELGDKEILSGVLLDENKNDLIKLVAVKDQAHWNYQPEAEYVWSFFKKYKRNIDTGQLELFSDTSKNEITIIRNKNKLLFFLVILLGISLYIVRHRKTKLKI